MPKPVKPELTFIGWLEEVFTIPAGISRETYAVMRKKYDNTYVVWLASSRATGSDVTDNDVVVAYTQGAEALSDLSGINSQISVKNLITEPTVTLQALGKKTIEQIASIDDLSSYRRGEITNRLVKGYVTDGIDKTVGKTADTLYGDQGQDLDKPDSMYLEGLDYLKVLPLSKDALIDRTTGTAKSKMQLLVDLKNGNDPNKLGDWEDRRVVEEQLSRDKKYKVYQTFAGSVVKSQLEVESQGTRLRSRIDANKNYARIWAEELGVDLDKVLNTREYKAPETIQDQYTTLTGARIRRDARLKSTEFDTIGSFHKTLTDPTKAAGNINALVSNPTFIEDALGMQTGQFGTLSPEMQLFVKDYLRLEDLELRSAVITPKDNYRTIVPKWESMGLTPTLGNTTYSPDNFVTGGFLSGDLEHLRNNLSTKIYTLTEGAQNKFRQELSLQLDRTFADPVIRSQKLNAAMKRLDAARNAAEMNNSVFAVATIRDMFEKIRDGDFINAALVSSRFLGIAPNAPQEMRSAGELAAMFDPAEMERIITTNIADKLYPRAKQIFPNLPKDTWQRIANPLTGARWGIGEIQNLVGISIKDPKSLGGTTANNFYNFVNDHTPLKDKFGGFFESVSVVEWPIRDAQTGNAKNEYKFSVVRAKSFKGIYGEHSVFDFLSNLNQDGLINHPNLNSPIVVADLLADFTKLDALYNEMDDVLGKLRSGATGLTNHEIAIAEIMDRMGMLHVDAQGLTIFEKYFDVYQNQFKPIGQKTLERFSDPNIFGKKVLPPNARLAFLQSLFDNGKYKELSKDLIGWLEKFNRFANGANNFVQKNIIYGNFLVNLPIIGKFLGPVVTPLQDLIRKMGFRDEYSLYKTVSDWRWIKKIDAALASLKNKLIGSSTPGIAGAGGANIFTRILGSKITSILGKVFQKLLVPALKMFGLGASAAASVATAGISYLVSLVAGTLFKITIKILQRDFRAIPGVIKDDVGGLVTITKKLIIYPILLIASCCLTPFVFIIILIAVIIPSSIAPFEPLGKATPADSLESMPNTFVVTKTANKVGFPEAQIGFENINYTVTIENISTTTSITIDALVDTMSMSSDCGKAVMKEGEFGFPGTKDPIPYDKFINVPIAPGSSLTVEYSLRNIPPFGAPNRPYDMTIFNQVAVTVQEEAGKVGYGNSSVDFGGGGCKECPSGLPLASFTYVSLCPGEVPAGGGKTHLGSNRESIDYAAGLGTAVYATHDGVAETGWDAAGYGNYVKVLGPGFTTIYAHLNTIDIKSGDPITKGMQIGTVDTTGNSTGNHLHYQFRGASCGGVPLVMAPPFIPSSRCD